MVCELCGEDDRRVLETHHIVPQRLGGADIEENLITLCANCHYKIEDLYDKHFWMRAQERILANCEDSEDSRTIYCTACAETFEPGADHSCTAQGEYNRKQQDGLDREMTAESFDPDRLNEEQQAMVAQEFRDIGKSPRWIADNVDLVEFSYSWVYDHTDDTRNQKSHDGEVV